MPKTFFNLKKFDNKFPIIKKQVKGSASDNMEIIENKNQLKFLIQLNKCFKNL